jgi:hypothetical protein
MSTQKVTNLTELATAADNDVLLISDVSASASKKITVANLIDPKVAALVDSAPATLDTLNELAAALGDDPNFATTVATQIGTKLNSADYTAADVLTKIKTVDGSGSGLDADTLDGNQATAFATAAQGALADSALQSIPDNYVLNSGDSITGDLSFGDNNKAIFGAGSDLQIYHDGSDSIIKQTTDGNILIQTDGADSIKLGDKFGNYLLEVNDNADVRLSYGTTPSLKLATTSTGIDVTGTVTADGLEVDKGGIGETASFSGDDVSGARALQIICSTTTNTGDTHSINAQSVNGILKLSTNNNTQRLRIASTGDISFYEDTGTTAKFFWDASAESLGIGTSSPSRALEVQQATNDQLRLSDTSGNGWEVRAGTNFIVKNNGTERMRIDSSGKLLVGTTSPSEKLTVNGGISATYGRSTLVTDNDGNFDLNAGQNFKCTPTGNITLDFTNVPNGQSGFVILDNSGGHTISADATTYRTSDILTQVTAAGVYLISYLTDGTSVYITGSTALANS